MTLMYMPQAQAMFTANMVSMYVIEIPLNFNGTMTFRGMAYHEAGVS